jgi:transposase-like protein
VELRHELVAFTQQRISGGGSASAAAKELGLNPATVIGWLNAAVQEVSAVPRMRRVEADDGPKAATRSELVLEIGDEVRVRGLRLEQLVELVRRLR